MRALFGFDPDAGRGATDAARDFERALSFYGEDYWLQVLRGPRTPYARLIGARRRLDELVYGEIARRRASGRARGGRAVAADGHRALGPPRPRRGDDAAVRGPRHDHRDDLVPVLGARASGRTGRTSTPRSTRRCGSTRRPGSARAARSRAFELHGHRIPAGVPVNYCSWASHRLPDVWEDPHAFRPERFLPGEREKIPRGAYVPFGGGSRICLGMRFGQLEIGIIAAAIRERFTLERLPGHKLEIRQTPTLGPRGGLPMRVRTRRQ